jgi:hypothetical protein
MAELVVLRRKKEEGRSGEARVLLEPVMACNLSSGMKRTF